MYKPIILDFQFAVGQAEYATGHVLKNDRSLHLVGDKCEDTFKVFNSFEEAKEFSIKTVQGNPDIECWIYDYTGQAVFGCDKNVERKLTPKVN